MPAVEHDGLVIWMPDTAAHIDTCVTPHLAPAPMTCVRLRRDDLIVLFECDPQMMTTADHDGLAASSVEVLTHVRLAARPTANRLVAIDESLVNRQARLRDEEPFALADESFVAPTQTVFRAPHTPQHCAPYFDGLQSRKRSRHVREIGRASCRE